MITTCYRAACVGECVSHGVLCLGQHIMCGSRLQAVVYSSQLVLTCVCVSIHSVCFHVLQPCSFAALLHAIAL